MHCIIVPNQRTDFREFVHDGYYLATVARFIHQADKPDKGSTDESKNVSDAISVSNSICRENSVSDGSQCIVNNRKFKMRRRRTRNQKKQ